jgi:hypothetical protein
MREEERPLEVVPSANVNDNDHPNVVPSYDEELAQVKRQCDKFKEALSEKKEQRRKVHSYLNYQKIERQFREELREEIERLKKENERLATIDPSEEDRFMDRDIERARDETYAKCLTDFEANIVVVEKKHDAELAATATAKYEKKCKEAHMLEAELEETNIEVEVVGDENDDDANDVGAKKCKVVAQPKANISAAHATFGDTVDTATRTRSNNTVKKSTKSLSVKIKALANMLMKKTTEHHNLVKDIALERKETENMLKQTTMSLESNLEDALQREKSRAREESTMRSSELEDHIVTLSRQLKVDCGS